MNDEGIHVGGISGFLKSIGFAIRLNSPTRCIIVFDGNGGSKKRREIFPEYKKTRKTRIRLNRMYTDISTADSEDISMKKQLYKIVDYLKCLPVSILSIDNIEADDTIAYLATQGLANDRITIMSSDKDFYQLVSDRIKVWSPTKKKLYGPEDIKTEFDITSNNFIFYRIMDGDVSDNIDGIKGAGIKTIIKAFPALKEETQLKLDDLIKHAEYNIAGLKIYKSVFDNKLILERNIKLMQLKDVDIPSSAKFKILDVVKAKTNELNKFKFVQKLTEDKMHGLIPNYHIWIAETFGALDMNARNQL